ncbi:hypothetical protein DL239_02250 [Sedimentitalea sp. CY04]|uniref:histidine kinase n=1 Tax=Parasedimentitalea denitrificans TaxID=2211118 RepID=A0ABX0W2D4_9RHOB|nr:hybrid sensor histidine kinase/response regulator [Sedimentitalea sp. CY04]NIZ59792.1 hypothetical protein [Sedimentitalea sp. CY04]
MPTPDRPNSVLAIDDNVDSLALLVPILRNLGYETRAGTSAEMAMKAIKASPPDIILLDVVMPRMNGIDFCKKLKAMDEYRNIPIIFLSGRITPEDKVAAFSAGASDYIEKPYNSEEVAARIRVHLALESLRKEQALQAETLEKLLRDRLAADKHREDQTTMLVHDLRSPLQGIGSVLEIVESSIDAASDPDLPDMIQTAIENVKHIAGYTNDMLELSRIETGQMPVYKRSVEAQKIFRQAKEILNHNPILQFEPTDLVVEADMQLTTRVLANLCFNALKYAGNSKQIEIQAQADGDDQVLFTVRDHGPGIPINEHEKVFGRFYQLNKVRQQDASSTGLGLAFCKKAIEAQGGKIIAQNHPEQGAVFSFWLGRAG